MNNKKSPNSGDSLSPPWTTHMPRALHQLEQFRREYTRNWRVNANSHRNQGHYAWMTAQVEGYLRILEIGCGVGHSTLALLKNGHSVVCVEENPHCIAATQTLLSEHGYSVAVIARESAHSLDDNAYRLDYCAPGDAPKADCLLIEGDALGDPQLEQWLKAQPRFDAVACWLLGTHNARGHNVAVDTRLMPSAFEHRIFVQNSVYELADEVLRPGGLLSVIDRGQTPDTDALKHAILDGHRDQASVTSLQVEKLEHTPYMQTHEEGAMGMQLTAPVASAVPTGPVTLSLTAVTSRKP